MTEDLVVEAIARVLGVDSRRLDPRAGPGTIEGWDSLMSIHVVMALEELAGRQLDLDGLAAATTVGDLARLVRQPTGPG